MSSQTAIRENTKRQRIRIDWISVGWTCVALAGFLVIWYVVSLITGSQLVPTPVSTFTRLADLIVTPFGGATLPVHVAASLGRWALGWGAAAVIGIPIGVALGAIPWIRAALAPIFEFLRYIPPFAWIPLSILWLGGGEASQALIVFIAAFPAVVISTQVVAAEVDDNLIRAGQNLGASSLRRLVNITFPMTLPGIETGLRVALSNGWMALIAAEMIAGRSGVGFLIMQSQNVGAIPTVVAGMIAIAAVAVILDFIIVRVGRSIMPWRQHGQP